MEKVFGIYTPFIHAYLDDLLAMPVILGITLQIFRWIHPAKNTFIFRKTPLLVAWIYVSIVFEWFLPTQSNQYIRDPWDILCYGLGTVYFSLFINQKKFTSA
ncbi:magnesium citrate secondary transporter [Algoriphagus hitonicola]|uniref:magnesium citrate secondary transporter n=1 Tax=Algoriphagus hitonicola TaxID=435880 RepID=UPI001FDFC5B5|nr:magnesium citrate secondary transporter [Algoriphagus hitonicola]